MTRKNYPSDISRKQFDVIAPKLESFRKRTKPREIDLYDIFCGILYVMTSGCQWRMLPHDYPKWTTVYSYYRQWGAKPIETEPSLLESLLQEEVMAHRLKDGRAAQTRLCIIDAQSVKNTDTAQEKGYDGGKKVSGIKRHIFVDTQGLPHAIVITTANVTDRNGAILAMAQHKNKLAAVTNILVDGGYTGEKFATAVRDAIGATVEVAKRSELHTFAVIPKRWVVERSFAWLEKCRRLWKNCERLLNNSLQFASLSFLSLLEAVGKPKNHPNRCNNKAIIEI